MKKKRKIFYIILFIFIILWLIQYNEIEIKTKERNKSKYKIINMNKDIKKMGDMKNKIEEKEIWKDIKKRINKTFS